MNFSLVNKDTASRGPQLSFKDFIRRPSEEREKDGEEEEKGGKGEGRVDSDQTEREGEDDESEEEKNGRKEYGSDESRLEREGETDESMREEEDSHEMERSPPRHPPLHSLTPPATPVLPEGLGFVCQPSSDGGIGDENSYGDFDSLYPSGDSFSSAPSPSSNRFPPPPSHLGASASAFEKEEIEIVEKLGLKLYVRRRNDGEKLAVMREKNFVRCEDFSNGEGKSCQRFVCRWCSKVVEKLEGGRVKFIVFVRHMAEKHGEMVVEWGPEMVVGDHDVKVYLRRFFKRRDVKLSAEMEEKLKVEQKKRVKGEGEGTEGGPPKKRRKSAVSSASAAPASSASSSASAAPASSAASAASAAPTASASSASSSASPASSASASSASSASSSSSKRLSMDVFPSPFSKIDVKYYEEFAMKVSKDAEEQLKKLAKVYFCYFSLFISC
jgi:hypothetical protein